MLKVWRDGNGYWGEEVVEGGWGEEGDYSECIACAFFTDAAQTPVLSKIGY